MSILSRITFTYVDKIVLFAFRAGRVSVDDLPAVSEDQIASHVKDDLLPVGRHSCFIFNTKLTGFKKASGSSRVAKEAALLLGNAGRFR